MQMLSISRPITFRVFQSSCFVYASATFLHIAYEVHRRNRGLGLGLGLE